MNLLQIVQEFCRRTGVAVPPLVATSIDEGVLQYMGLLNEVLEDVTSRGESWPRLQKVATWTSPDPADPANADGLQGSLDTLFPYGFQYIIWDSAWDRTLRRQLFGPKSAQLWQESLALPFTGPFYAYRIRAGNLYIQPSLEGGHELALEYASNYAIQYTDDGGSVTYKRYFTSDRDVFLLDEAILIRGLRWAWKKEKGLPFAQDYKNYEDFLAQQLAAKGDQPVLRMDGRNEPSIRPGIFVSSGSWPVSNS